MNENLKKYRDALTQIALRGDLKDLDKFANILKENDLLLQANIIIEEARHIALAEIYKRKVLIRSAKVLTKEERSKIIKKVEERYGSDFTFEEAIDESLIEGHTVELFGEKIDLSLKGRINNLREHLS